MKTANILLIIHFVQRFRSQLLFLMEKMLQVLLGAFISGFQIERMKNPRKIWSFSSSPALTFNSEFEAANRKLICYKLSEKPTQNFSLSVPFSENIKRFLSKKMNMLGCWKSCITCEKFFSLKATGNIFKVVWVAWRLTYMKSKCTERDTTELITFLWY